MNVAPKVKCRRCGEEFSSLRSTCPVCGTRRTAQSSRTPNTTPSTVRGTRAAARAESNMKWQMIFGLILVVAVILAVIVMVSTGLNGEDNSNKHVSTTPPPAAIQTDGPPQIEPAPTPTPTPTPTVQTLQIFYVTTDKTNQDFTMRYDNNEELTLNAKAWPADVINIADVKWSCDSEDVLKITDNGDGTVLLKIIGKKDSGYATITAELYGVKAQCFVYCK